MKRIIASLMLLLSGIGFSQTVENPSQVKIKTAKKLGQNIFEKEVLFSDIL